MSIESCQSAGQWAMGVSIGKCWAAAAAAGTDPAVVTVDATQ